MSFEPQSIVHQVVRAASAITTSMRKRKNAFCMGRNSRNELTRGRICNSASSLSSSCAPSLAPHCEDPTICCDDEHSTSEVETELMTVEELKQFISVARRSPPNLEIVREEGPLLPSISKDLSTVNPFYGEYRTINQNEFFIEVLVKGHSSCVIHFFDETSNHSQAIDCHLQKLASRFCSCNFLRIDGAWTQFISTKLFIRQYPTVLAIQNRDVLDRMTDFNQHETPVTQIELEQWVIRTLPSIQTELE